MQLDFVTKLGGSAITNKRCFETLDVNRLNFAAEVLGKCHKSGLKFVVVHGAGSFGHHQADQYGVNSGYGDENVSKEHVMTGFCKTRLSVCKLNHEVVSALVNCGVPAVSVSPCGTWTMNGGVLVTDGTEIVHQLINEGFVPCLHGDCVLNQSLGCKILSGDVIIQKLCEVFSPKHAIFFTDVAGVYTKSPGDVGAKLVPHITTRHDGTITTDLQMSTDRSCDVTGGIAFKLDCACNIVRHHNGRVKVMICTGTAYHNVCINGNFDGELGTVIECQEISEGS